MKKLTRFLSLMLAAALLFRVTALSADRELIGKAIYRDWDSIGDSFKEAVFSLSIHSDGLGVFQGSDGKFNPKEVFTRAEVLSFVSVVANGGNPNKLALNSLFAIDAAREPMFKDVPKTHWAFGAINYAARMGFIEGTGGSNFNPSAAATVDMVNSMLLSLLGVKPEDKNGADWITRTTSFMVTHNIKLDAHISNFNPTREEVASALYIAVNTKVFTKNADGTYSQKEKTLRQSAFEDDKGSDLITLTGKVVGTKYASLNKVNNYNASILLEGVGVNDGKANKTIFRLETPEKDDVVPVALLGRVVTLKVVKVSEGIYRAADGEKAVPLYSADIVALPLYNDGTLNEQLYNAAIAEIPNTSSDYEYAGIRGNSVQFRGAYANYDAIDGFNSEWKPPSSWSYAYAITFGNTNYYSEVFFLNYRALMVSDISRDGTLSFRALDGVTSVGVNDAKGNDFENGASLIKGDVIVAVVNSKNNIVTAEKVAPKTGIKQGNPQSGGVLISGVSYELWDNHINYANRQMLGSWCGGVQNLFQNSSPVTYWEFCPVYGEYTGSKSRIFNIYAAASSKEPWFEWRTPDYCIVIDAKGGAIGGNAAVTIAAANGSDSGTYLLNNLFVRDVKAMSWLGDVRMHSSLAKNPVKGVGLINAAATKGITLDEKAAADGLFWISPLAQGEGQPGSDKNALSGLSGINIYSYKITSGYIDLTELDAGNDSGMEILLIAKEQSEVKSGNTLVINNHTINRVLFAEGRVLGNWLEGLPVTSEYSLDTANTVWFTLKGRESAFQPSIPTSLSNWRTGYPDKSPEDYIFVFAANGEVKFILYEEEGSWQRP